MPASLKLASAAASTDGDDAKMDMSPMIDMVFLLLIFFMIASVILEIKQAKDVDPPIAPNAQVGKVFKGRVVVNVYQDGTFFDMTGRADGGKELREADITQLCADMVRENQARGVKTRLHLRADQGAPVIAVKKATKAAADGGVIDVIFSSYQTPFIGE
ncbi:MAG: biopolymer transporter ExbD [Verrucomicrobiota bacterium]